MTGGRPSTLENVTKNTDKKTVKIYVLYQNGWELGNACYETLEKARKGAYKRLDKADVVEIRSNKYVLNNRGHWIPSPRIFSENAGIVKKNKKYLSIIDSDVIFIDNKRKTYILNKDGTLGKRIE